MSRLEFICLSLSDKETAPPVARALTKGHADMSSLFATPDPDLEDQQVIGEIHHIRASLADFCARPRAGTACCAAPRPRAFQALTRSRATPSARRTPSIPMLVSRDRCRPPHSHTAP